MTRRTAADIYRELHGVPPKAEVGNGHGNGYHPPAGKEPVKDEVPEPTIYTLPEIMAMSIPEPKWAVPGLLCEGLTILAGKPKLGKSFLALNLGVTIAAGGVALGHTTVVPGDVLYITLEDRLRRVKDRAAKLLPGLGHEAPERLHVAVEWPRMYDGLAPLERWIRRVGNPRLVIIDVWPKFKPARGGPSANQYDLDSQDMGALKSLADKHGVSVLCLLHCKKAAADDVVDEISGTLGLAGTADGLIVLARARGENDAELFLSGRDIEESNLAIHFDPQTFVWTSLGNAEEAAEGKLRGAIVALFRDSAGEVMSTAQVADELRVGDEQRAYLRNVLKRLVDQETIERVRPGYYRWCAGAREHKNGASDVLPFA